jgi:hypothetical protein
MFGLAICAHGSSDQNVFLGVATVADREDLSAFGIHDCQGASRFEMNRTSEVDLCPRCVTDHRREHFLLRIDPFFADEKAS